MSDLDFNCGPVIRGFSGSFYAPRGTAAMPTETVGMSDLDFNCVPFIHG